MNNQISVVHTTAQYRLARSKKSRDMPFPFIPFIYHNLFFLLLPSLLRSLKYPYFPLSKLLNSVPWIVRKVHASQPPATSLSACSAVLCYKACIARYSLVSSLLVELTLRVYMVQWCKSLSSRISYAASRVLFRVRRNCLACYQSSRGNGTRGSVKGVRERLR